MAVGVPGAGCAVCEGAADPAPPPQAATPRTDAAASAINAAACFTMHLPAMTNVCRGPRAGQSCPSPSHASAMTIKRVAARAFGSPGPMVPAVEASVPRPPGPPAMTQPGSLPVAVLAGVDRAKASAQRRASGSRKRPAICWPSATARQPASHQQCSAMASQPASQVGEAQRPCVAHRTAGPAAEAEQTVTRLEPSHLTRRHHGRPGDRDGGIPLSASCGRRPACRAE